MSNAQKHAPNRIANIGYWPEYDSKGPTCLIENFNFNVSTLENFFGKTENRIQIKTPCIMKTKL